MSASANFGGPSASSICSLLNALTIVTEFVGIALALDYLGVSKELGVALSAVAIMAAVSTGDFRRFERFALALCAGSLLLVPIFLMIHPPVAEIARDMVVARFPKDAKVNEVMLLIIAIVGTTIAPWQLFFQQSYVIDKRITPRFIGYERVDLWLGIIMVIVGAVAMMAFTAAAFGGKPEFGNFTDAGAVASGLEKYAGRLPGVLFALALIDASVIGASAVSLSTAYAIGDVLSLKHSLHRKPADAKGFYAVYCGLIVVAAGLVLTPGAPLGLLTNAVQTLAGVLLPSATVFLLLLCNDKVSSWSLEQYARHEPLHRGGDRGSRDAVDHSHRVCLVSGGNERDCHTVGFRRRNGAGRVGRHLQRGAPQNGGR